MKTVPPPDLERGRELDGPWGSPRWFGISGKFHLAGPCGAELTVIVGDGTDWPFAPPAWEHVSVSTKTRTPNWREMEYVRDLCWEPHELVLQFSVPRAQHINIHEHCLHMWRPIGVPIPLPPACTVGVPVREQAAYSEAW